MMPLRSFGNIVPRHWSLVTSLERWVLEYRGAEKSAQILFSKKWCKGEARLEASSLNDGGCSNSVQ
jgi:hypothetical protein